MGQYSTRSLRLEKEFVGLFAGSTCSAIDISNIEPLALYTRSRSQSSTDDLREEAAQTGIGQW